MTPPTYIIGRLKKAEVYIPRLPTDKEVISALNVSKKLYDSWAVYIPPPYADRLILSNYGELPCVPRYVPVESALIIFKDKKLLGEHFGEDKEWVEDRKFLPELPSAYMLKHFGEFVQGYTEIK